MLKKYFIAIILLAMPLLGMEEALRKVEPSLAVSEIPFKKTYLSLLAVEPALLGYVFLLDFFNHEAHTKAADDIPAGMAMLPSEIEQLKNAGFFSRRPRLKQLAGRLSSLLKIDETGALVKNSKLFSAIPYNDVDALTLVCNRFAYHDYQCLLRIFHEHYTSLNEYGFIERMYGILDLLNSIKIWQEELTLIQSRDAALFNADKHEWLRTNDDHRDDEEDFRKLYEGLALPHFGLEKKVIEVIQRNPDAFTILATGNHGFVSSENLKETASAVFSQSQCIFNWLFCIGTKHHRFPFVLQRYLMLLASKIDALYIAAHMPTPQAIAKMKDYLIKHPTPYALQMIRNVALETKNDALIAVVDEVTQASHAAD